MELDDFYDKVSDIKIDFNIESEIQRKCLLSNEVLFQLPFISMVVLLLAKERSKPKVPEISDLVGKCLEDSMPTFKKSNQYINWSANLMIRTVQAMQILEVHQLISIDNSISTIKITKLGKKVVSKALNSDDNLAWSLGMIQDSYQSIRKHQQFESEIE